MSKFELVEKPQSELNKYKVTIVGDSNDADYITTINKYTVEDFCEYVLDGLIHLKEHGSGRHKLEDYDNEFDLDLPYGDIDICHTLKKVEVEYTDSNGKVWNVKY